MLSLWRWPKVITLRGLHCSTKLFQKCTNQLTDYFYYLNSGREVLSSLYLHVDYAFLAENGDPFNGQCGDCRVVNVGTVVQKPGEEGKQVRSVLQKVKSCYLNVLLALRHCLNCCRLHLQFEFWTSKISPISPIFRQTSIA